MEFLKLLESIRTPFLDSFFSVITILGEELAFMVTAMIIFWCVDKYNGYFVLTVGFIGTLINQFLKILCRIPRPWIKDPSFTVVESAVEEATGYSFPSGHTQSSVGTFGSIVRFTKKTAVRIICIILCILVPFSRMYLGVHTPKDVIASFIIAIVLIFALYPVMKAARKKPVIMCIALAVMLVCSALFLIFTEIYNLPVSQELLVSHTTNLASAQKNAYTLLGCISGLIVVYFLDERFIRFDTKAVWWMQIIKVVGGLILLLAIKEGLRSPLESLISNVLIARSVRYFLLVLAGGALWPFIFTKLSKKPRLQLKNKIAYSIIKKRRF